MQAYWTFCEELTVEDVLVLKGTRIVIPKSMHNHILTMIHEGHLGLGKCKLWIKDTIYWPGINEQLQKLVLNCELCLKYSKAKNKQPENMSLGQRGSNIPMDKSCNWYIPLQKWLKSTYHWLHKQIPCSMQANIHNSAASCKPNETNILRVWLARDYSIWQQTLLLSWIIHQADDRLQCEPYN